MTPLPLQDNSFPCSICQKFFTHKKYLKAHLETHNSNRKRFTCSVVGCGKKLASKRNLEKHIEKIHSAVKVSGSEVLEKILNFGNLVEKRPKRQKYGLKNLFFSAKSKRRRKRLLLKIKNQKLQIQDPSRKQIRNASPSKISNSPSNKFSFSSRGQDSVFSGSVDFSPKNISHPVSLVSDSSNTNSIPSFSYSPFADFQNLQSGSGLNSINHNHNHLEIMSNSSTSSSVFSPIPRDDLNDEANRNFSCSFCPKKFTRKKYLKAHLETHNLVRKYFICTVSGCGKKLTSKRNLDNHLEKIHMIDKQSLKSVDSSNNNLLHLSPFLSNSPRDNYSNSLTNFGLPTGIGLENSLNRITENPSFGQGSQHSTSKTRELIENKPSSSRLDSFNYLEDDVFEGIDQSNNSIFNSNNKKD